MAASSKDGGGLRVPDINAPVGARPGPGGISSSVGNSFDAAGNPIRTYGIAQQQQDMWPIMNHGIQGRPDADWAEVNGATL